MGPEALAQVLRPLISLAAPAELLVGLHKADDAAVYRVNDSQAVISTADFFPPVVDDPYAFGAIAAANALSDVYAMGGQVMMAINIVAWPDDLESALLSEILQGSADTVAQAGAVIAGGHTITDKEVVSGKQCQLGYADDMTANKLEPHLLNSGITLIGKRTHLPDNLKVGRNCKIGTDLRPEDFVTDVLVSGDTIEDHTFAHGWERDLARRPSVAP